MTIVIARRCRLDEVPLALHARCWRCSALAGPNHVAGSLVQGLCRRCRERLARAETDQAWARGSLQAHQNGVGRLLSTREAAIAAGLSPSTIRRLVAAGRLHPVEDGVRQSRSPNGRRHRFRTVDVAALTRSEQLINSD